MNNTGSNGLNNFKQNVIHLKREETAMLEKFVQAAIITFLLHLIAGLSPATINTEAVPPSGTMSGPIASALQNFVK
jgi:hypothetical protein